MMHFLAFVLVLVLTTQAQAQSHDQGHCDQADENGHLTIAEGQTAIASFQYFNCSNIKSVTIPDTVLSIGQETFTYCGELTSVNFGSGSQLQSIGVQAFLGAGLGTFEVPPLVTSIAAEAFSMNYKLHKFTFAHECKSNLNVNIYPQVFELDMLLLSIELPAESTYDYSSIGTKVKDCS